jgi:hypothetical protein
MGRPALRSGIGLFGILSCGIGLPPLRGPITGGAIGPRGLLPTGGAIGPRGPLDGLFTPSSLGERGILGVARRARLGVALLGIVYPFNISMHEDFC